MDTIIVYRAIALMPKALDRDLPEEERRIRIAELLEMLNPVIGED